MNIESDRLKTLKSQAERAQATFEEAEKKLERPDGSKLFSDDVHEEELAELRSGRRRTLEPIQMEAARIRAEAETEAGRARHFDPMEVLTDEDLTRANARRAFAIDAAQTLPVDSLKGRLEAVLAEGDKGLVYAHWMAGQRRGESIRERAREARRGAGASTNVETVTELDDVLGRMEAALVGNRKETAIQEARARADEAIEVEMLAAHLKEGDRNAAEAYVRRTYGPTIERIREEQAERERRNRTRLGQAG